MNKFRKMGLIDYDGNHLKIDSFFAGCRFARRTAHQELNLRVEAARSPEWHCTKSTARRLPDDQYCRQRENANAGAALS
jgi:hypothetical protein